VGPEVDLETGEPVEDGGFTVEIGADVTGLLFPSVYQLYLLASSDELARVTERVVDLSIGV